MDILAEIATQYTAILVLKAERACEMAAIHNAACRYCRQGVVCSTRADLDARAARLARLTDEAAS